MIVADTSIWIDYLKGGFSHSVIMSTHIEIRDVLMLECIAGELLQGARSAKERNIILEYWSLLPTLSMDSLWVEAGIYSSENKLLSKGVGLIDSVIIAACRETESKLWTLDEKIKKNIDKRLLFSPK